MNPAMTQPMAQFQTQPSWSQPPHFQGNGQQESQLWKDFTVGLLGGAVGVLVMDLFRQNISPLLTSEENGEGKKGGQEGSLDSISLVGQQHRPEESSTDALGRMAYQAVRPMGGRRKGLPLRFTKRWFSF